MIVAMLLASKSRDGAWTVAALVLAALLIWGLYDYSQGNNPFDFFTASTTDGNDDAAGGIDGGSDAGSSGDYSGTGGIVANAFSQNGVTTLEGLETFSPKAYWDVSGWAIGYGSHTYADGSPVQEGDTISQDDAEALLLNNASTLSAWLNSNVKVPLDQGQFDALVIWLYNIGVNWKGVVNGTLNTTLLTQLNLGNYAAASDQFGAWVKGKVNGAEQTLSALVTREGVTTALFNSGGGNG